MIVSIIKVTQNSKLKNYKNVNRDSHGKENNRFGSR